jgi:hypothetical protein
MSQIELRLSSVDPPAPEPKRTIYRDIVNLPDPVKLGITIRYFNYDDVGLYFQITGSGTGYTFGTVNLGLLASGANAYINLDEFASRAKPSTGDLPNGEMEENITLTLKAYTDSGYTNLKWTFERVVTVHWINSADAAFTVNELDNFDDGTVQGWSAVAELRGVASLEVATDYALSPPYSLRLHSHCESGYTCVNLEVLHRIEKAFTTPNKSKVYGVIDIRVSSGTGPVGSTKYAEVRTGSATLVHLGKLYVDDTVDYIPIGKWMRIVIPLPSNVSVTIQIAVDRRGGASGYGLYGAYLWLDDFKLISK